MILSVLDEVAKKLFKYKNYSQKVFTGVINIEKMSKEIILQLYTVRFQNMMMVSEYSKDLLQKLTIVRYDSEYRFASMLKQPSYFCFSFQMNSIQLLFRPS